MSDHGSSPICLRRGKGLRRRPRYIRQSEEIEDESNLKSIQSDLGRFRLSTSISTGSVYGLCAFDVATATGQAPTKRRAYAPWAFRRISDAVTAVGVSTCL